MYDLVNSTVIKQTSGSFVSTIQIAQIKEIVIHGHRDFDIVMRNAQVYRTDGFTPDAYSRILSSGVRFSYP